MAEAPKKADPPPEVSFKQVLSENTPFIVFGTCMSIFLALFIASTIVSYNLAQSSSLASLSFDHKSQPGDTSSWFLTPVTFPTFYYTAGDAFATINRTINDPPNPFLPNLCNDTACDYSTYQGPTKGLFSSLYSSKGLRRPLMLNQDNPYANYARLELSWGTLTPSPSGGTVTLNYHVSLPNPFVDGTKTPSPSLFNVQFDIGGSTPINIPEGSTTFDGTISLRLEQGALSLYPEDVYVKTLTFNAYIIDTKPYFANNSFSILPQPLNFLLKFDKHDLGNFNHRYTFTPASQLDQGYEGFTMATMRFEFHRSTVAKIFPYFIIVAFWLVLIFETIFYAPFILRGAKLNAAPAVTVSVSLLFALPSIRNSMPGSPPIGGVLDFASFYWALLATIMLFVVSVFLWFFETRPAPPPPKPAAPAK